MLECGQFQAQLVVRRAGNGEIGMPAEGDRHGIVSVGLDHRGGAEGSGADLEGHFQPMRVRKQCHQVRVLGPVEYRRGTLRLDPDVGPVREAQEEAVAGQSVVPFHFGVIRPGV